MRLIFLFFLSLSISGCHDQLQGDPDHIASKRRMTCIDGVEYMVFPNSYGDSVTAHLKSDGTVFTCK